jgi:hypothetical protein
VKGVETTALAVVSNESGIASRPLRFMEGNGDVLYDAKNARIRD